MEQAWNGQTPQNSDSKHAVANLNHRPNADQPRILPNRNGPQKRLPGPLATTNPVNDRLVTSLTNSRATGKRPGQFLWVRPLIWLRRQASNVKPCRLQSFLSRILICDWMLPASMMLALCSSKHAQKLGNEDAKLKSMRHLATSFSFLQPSTLAQSPA